MASTILSDNGVSSSSAGIKTTADSTGALALQTTTAGGAATTALTIDTSQNVGIGTASPNKKLEVLSTGEIIRATSTTASNDQLISIKNDSGTANCSTNIFFADRYAASSYASSYIRGTSSGTSALIFATGGTNFTNIYDAGAPTEKARVNAFGIGVGGAIPSSGTGIAFPATQSASTDANTLDDYEEGTWTPVATSNAGSITTYSVTASYVKIGRIVNCTFTVTVTNIGTASSFMNISGFPFSSITPASGFNTATGTCRENALTGTLYQFYLTTGSSSGTAQTTAGGAVTWGNNMSMNFNITYLTTS